MTCQGLACQTSLRAGLVLPFPLSGHQTALADVGGLLGLTRTASSLALPRADQNCASGYQYGAVRVEYGSATMALPPTTPPPPLYLDNGARTAVGVSSDQDVTETIGRQFLPTRLEDAATWRICANHFDVEDDVRVTFKAYEIQCVVCISISPCFLYHSRGDLWSRYRPCSALIVPYRHVATA